LETSLADGTRTRFHGLVSEVAMLVKFGGMVLYRLRLQPWLWSVGKGRNSRVWHKKTVIKIVGAVFRQHAPLSLPIPRDGPRLCDTIVDRRRSSIGLQGA
jgi:type VI secretion system secreted protein VgrG